MLGKPHYMTWRNFILGLFVPHSLAVMIVDLLYERRLTESLELQKAHSARPPQQDFRYEAAVSHLLGRGLPEEEVRGGSMPEASLECCGAVFRKHFDAARPLTVLHVGNFVGVSLAWMADFARTWSSESRVVAIDPNVTHRGISRPQEHVVELLCSFGLDDRVLLLTGYTLGKNPGDLLGHEAFARDQGCQNALSMLAALAPGSVDVALIDGNHEPPYLREEIAQARALLRPGGLLVLDDIFTWHLLAPVARELRESPEATLLAEDQRIGIWQLPPLAGAKSAEPPPTALA